MLTRYSNWLYRISTSRLTLAASILFLLFVGLVLANQANPTNFNREKANMPDLMLWYSSADLYNIAEEYGLEGREAYNTMHFTFDIIWPLIYTLFLSTTISWIYQRISTSSAWWMKLNLAPTFAMLLDFLENSATSWVMSRYPQPSPLAAALSPLFTFSKWVFVLLSAAILLSGIAIGIGKLIKGKAQ